MAFFNFRNYRQGQWQRPVPQLGGDEVYGHRDAQFIDEPYAIPIYPYQELVLPLTDRIIGTPIPAVFQGIDLPDYIQLRGSNLVVSVPGNIAELSDAEGNIEVEIEAEN